jgi:malonyl CoA-acyl carrier protein transacylase
VAGVLSFEDALTLVAERGRLMQQLPEDGEMVTVFAEEERVVPLLAPYAAEVSIAAVNSPETVVISGRRAVVLSLVEALKTQKIRTRRLNISRAAHSPMVESMIPAIARTSAGMRFSPPQVEFFSAVSGEAVSEALTHPEYWQRHLRQTVRFAAAARALYDAGYRTFLEIGPNPTLLSLAQRSVPENEPALWLPSLRDGWADRDQMLESLAQLYVHGANVDWAAFNDKVQLPKIPLPLYPWERKSYWWIAGGPGRQPERPPPARPVPVWEIALSAGKQQAQQVPLELEISTFPSKWNALNDLAVAYITNALHQLGAFAQPGERHTRDTLLEKCGILPVYGGLMSRWLKLLADCGQLQPVGDGAYLSLQALHPEPVDGPRAAADSALADAPFVTDYVNECGERLTGVITGKESPLELMFPGGSMERAEALYQHWAHARYFHQIVAAVAQALGHANPGKTLRLLEIGAGTGSTTAVVLPALPAGRAAYHFTDVSDLFLDHARQKFAAYPFVHYGLLDIEKDGLAQGYGRGQFDVIIAANVIHATRSLSQTLQNVRSLLAPQGVLVLFEATQHQPWFDITTGLIEGWQSFGDDLRADSPLLTAAQWETILQAEEFVDVAVLPQPGSPAEILGESVILARPQGEALEAAAIEAGEVRPEDVAAPKAAAPADVLLQRLKEALPDERKEILLDFVRGQVVSVLRLGADSLPDRRARLMDLGVDSLMAVELRGQLSRGLKLERKLPATLIFDYPTIEAITNYLLAVVLVFEPVAEPTSAAAGPAPAPQTSTDLQALSDDEVEAMLLAKLKKIK